MDTRTPRTPTGGRSSGFDDAPALAMVKVPCDPAQVVVNHASFRVQFPTTRPTQSPRVGLHLSAAADTGRVPGARRAPIVWSGKSEPGDAAASGLLQAVRNSGAGTLPDNGYTTDDAGATQVIPRVNLGEGSHRYGRSDFNDQEPYSGYAGYGGATGFSDDTRYDDTIETPVVTGTSHPGTDADDIRLLTQLRSAGSAYEEHLQAGGEFTEGAYGTSPYSTYDSDGYGPYRPGVYGDGYDEESAGEGEGRAARRHGSEPVRHAYYPGRRMNLGVVLLPLRILLGFVSIYAGMGKLCDPVYFDRTGNGSMAGWLHSLQPWAAAGPLHDFALRHPVGVGLSVAFLQVIVGALTVLGLWQRLAAATGALLAAGLLLAVSWKTAPVYEAADIIYLAAWSPLVIAGAPVYSVDGRLASEAWRTLGPRAGLWELRRRVLRRGALVTTVAVGLTLLVGALLGSAVRDAGRVTVPGPGEPPRNELPGSPLPQKPDQKRGAGSKSPSVSGSPTQGQGAAAGPSQSASSSGAARETAGSDAGQPSQTQGTGQAPSQGSTSPQAPPASSAGPSSGGGTTGGGSGGTGSGGTGSDGSGGGDGGSDGFVGGILG
ncbi:DoxX family membrane protein [Streptomyces sp. PSKA54]|uniref:DoxX family membrane protein n=1 Tax=Streptomyces himalayensis subsp. aureolus TaxID=2758039 RepID=A0A7W2HJ96_9ACTN|nr:DoxX family membrane protein [Streptomyces himalayensis subsp. aureolus]